MIFKYGEKWSIIFIGKKIILNYGGNDWLFYFILFFSLIVSFLASLFFSMFVFLFVSSPSFLLSCYFSVISHFFSLVSSLSFLLSRFCFYFSLFLKFFSQVSSLFSQVFSPKKRTRSKLAKCVWTHKFDYVLSKVCWAHKNSISFKRTNFQMFWK